MIATTNADDAMVLYLPNRLFTAGDSLGGMVHLNVAQAQSDGIVSVSLKVIGIAKVYVVVSICSPYSFHFTVIYN
jgi:hypothetical protein